MPLNSNLAFSQTHGGSYLFYSDASTVELEIASGGITVDGTCTVGDLVTRQLLEQTKLLRLLFGVYADLCMVFLYTLTVLQTFGHLYNPTTIQTREDQLTLNGEIQVYW